MPTYPIQLKRNGTAAATPSSLLHGEVALNYADGKIFWKDASNVIQSFTFQTYATSSHTHGNITSAGAIGSTANLPIITTTSGVLTTGSFGTSAATFCEGNDSRLSDTRTPTDGSVTTAKIANDAVTYAKIQNVSATDRLLGRSSAGAGDVEEVTCTAFGRSLIDDADAAAARTTLSVQPTASPAFTGAATFTVSSGSSVPVSIANSGTGNSLVVATNFIVDGSGRLGFNAAPRAFEQCSLLGTAPSSLQTSLGFRVQCTFPSSSTSDAVSFSSYPVTQAASYTLANLTHFGAYFQGVGAGSTVTNQYGFFAESNLTGATNNYGFYGNIASGTGRWNFYANGTAASFFGGQVQISAGSASAPGVAFSGDGNTGLFSPIADVVAWATNGSERMRVSSTGNVTIGEANSANTRLMVAGGSSNISSARATYEGTVQVNESSLTSLEATGGIEFKASVFGSGYGAKLSGLDDGSFAIGNRANSATWSERLRINQNGEVLIGTTTDNGAYLLQVNSQIYATNATIATSDARFKANVQSLTDATAVIEALRPVAFDFIPHAERNFATERQVGLIAQEAEAALAGCDYADSVVAQCGDHLGLAYEKLVPVLIRALQESNARIAALEERINA